MFNYYTNTLSIVFYVTVVTFLVTFFKNKFASTVIPTYFSFIEMPIIETKFGIICIITNL